MGLSFPIAQSVQAGERPFSTRHNKLAAAFSRRILSGVADGAWRIIWMMLGLVRQPRNPRTVSDGAYEWPAVDEFYRYFGLHDPRRNPGFEWQLIGAPGEETGWNLGWPVAAYVFGNDALDLASESARMDLTMRTPDDRVPETALDWWELAKQQRGGVDAAAGVQLAPALQLAQYHYRIGYHDINAQLKTYGGFFPSPIRVGDCGDEEEGVPATPVYQIKFYRSVGGVPTGEERIYYGFCRPETPGAALSDAIWGVAYGEFYYRVYRYDGTVEDLDVNEWTEGPYTGGGVLRRGKGQQLDEVLNWYAGSFAGNTEQRAGDDYRIRQVAFGFQEFLSRQYSLAPARGTYSGGTMTVSYPRWEETAPTDGWTVGTGDQVPKVGAIVSLHVVAAGYVAAGFFASVEGLASGSTVRLELWAYAVDESDQQVGDGWRVADCTLGEGDQVLRYFDASQVPRYGGSGRVGVEWHYLGPATWQAGGSLVIEVAELQDYMPRVNDAFFVLRMASSSGGDGFGNLTGLDGYGTDYAGAKEISDEFMRYGAVVNPRTTSLPEAQTLSGDALWLHPVYEAMRRLVMENTRLSPRQLLVGYEVLNGQSILYFKRLMPVLGGGELDAFAGIAPALDAVENGSIRAGWRYEVRGGVAIRYHGADVAAGSEFEGAVGVPSWSAAEGSTGAEEVYEVEGIRAVAPPAGEDNRWCLFWSWNPYKDEENSLWKPDNYGDVLCTLPQRCHLGSMDLRANKRLLTHFAYGQSTPYGPLYSEAPTGYIYAMGANQWPIDERYGTPEDEARAIEYYGSCQIYEAPYEVASVRAIEVEGQARVKVVLTGRLRTVASAPWRIENAPAGWAEAWFAGQPRTDENGVMEYLAYQATGRNCARQRVGDTAPADSADRFWSTLGAGAPFGGCFPRAWWVRLPRQVAEDVGGADATVDPERDTRMLSEHYSVMELYLRAMCEGYVDEQTTVNLQNCDATESHLFDYTFENLMSQVVDAEGRSAKWIRFLPWSVRGEGPKGFGPLPNTQIYAEIFNLYATAINLLTRARVEIPLDIEWRQKFRSGWVSVEPAWESTDDGGSCTGEDYEFGNSFGYVAGSFTAPASGDWTPAGDWSALELGQQFGASLQASLFGGQKCLDGTLRWAVGVDETRVEYRIPSTSLGLNAVPEEIRELLETGSFGFLVRETAVVSYDVVDNNGAYVECSTQSSAGNGPVGLKVRGALASSSGCRLLPTSGQLGAAALPSDIGLWKWAIADPGGSGFICGNVASSTRDWRIAPNVWGGNLYVEVPLTTE